MKLSAKVEYAVKAVLELALRHGGGKPVQLEIIARHQQIPEKFLVQLLLRLKQARIVASARGAAGGYFLAKTPSEITVGDVFRAIDSQFLETPKTRRGGAAGESDRIFFELCKSINDEVTKRLSITVEDLLKETKAQVLNYQI